MDETHGGGLLYDGLLMALCYVYVLLMISVSERLGRVTDASGKAARKFLHAFIGNLTFVIPFFEWRLAPFLVTAPFIAVTFVASPHSPFQDLRRRLRRLSDLTEEGHDLGLILYSVSYALLALLFATKPAVMAAGVLPMAYGDSAAALVGERYGGRRGQSTGKSLAGSQAMFSTSFLSIAVGFVFFSFFHPFSASEKIVHVAAVSVVVTLVEYLSPRGFDNLTVPLLGAATFLIVDGWL